MRNFNMFFLIILLTIELVACGSPKILYKEGEYEGIGEGHHGQIKILVTTDQYRIKEIKIIDQQETPVLSDIVYEKIPQKIIKKNTAEVDVVAGATFTSNGLIEAICDGLNKAKNKQE